MALTQECLIAGPAGRIDVSIDLPDAAPRGLALVGHPHPLFGGSKHNKVAQILARTFAGLGYATVRPNFRGVGQTEGEHDHGIGEQDDLLAVLGWMRARLDWSPEAATLPLALSGFSFGSFVISQVARRLAEAGAGAERLVLVGTAAGRWAVAPVPADTLVIHGELDTTIPLADVLDWARPQALPVIVLPGADHFFHRRLSSIRRLIEGAWTPRS